MVLVRCKGDAFKHVWPVSNTPQNTTKLQHQLFEREQLLAEQKRQYDLLKVAKTIDGRSTNTRDTKLKINTLIREIDKCIVQLNE